MDRKKFSCALASVGILLCSQFTVAKQESNSTYQVDIKRTEYGIPHISGKSYQDVGFGLGYVFAQDNYCVFSKEILTIRSQLSKYISASEKNIGSDLFHKIIEVNEKALVAWPKLSFDTRELIQGYSAGLNHYKATSNINERCNTAEAVNTITPNDIVAYQLAVAMNTSSGQFIKELVTAQAPSESPHVAASHYTSDKDYRDLKLGSNAWAIGDKGGKYKQSFLLANPHFPWDGGKRFYMAHLKIPGKFDVMGASLFGVPAIQIGFNQHISWTHTVSESSRFVIYALELDQSNPLKYKLNDQFVEMKHKSVTIEVKQPDGSVKPLQKDYYMTHFGPIVSAPEKGLGWSKQQAYTLADSNWNNAWFTEQWLDINQAKSIDEMTNAIADIQGLPWVNTIATAHDGKAFYGDTSRVPLLDNAQLKSCFASPRAEAIFQQMGIAILSSTKAKCNVFEHGQMKIFPFSQAPKIITDDHVANSNNTHWAPHISQRLEGYSDLYGGERNPLSLRARSGLLMLQKLLQKRDRLSLESLQAALLSNHSYSAQLLLTDTLGYCKRDELNRDLNEACNVLEKWDTKSNLDSVGAHIFREFVMTLKDEVGKFQYFSTPFNVNDPINTPHGLIEDGALIERAMKKTIQFLNDKQLPLDAKLGDIQFVRRAEKNIPMHGGLGQVGVFNIIDGPIHQKEGYEVAYGSSFIMLVELSNKGPVAKGVLTYSQSTDEFSPYFQDQTQLFAMKRLYHFPFTEKEIKKHTIESYSLEADKVPY